MGWRRELTDRLQGLNVRPEHEAEIVEELAQHLDDRVNELIAGGKSPEVARATALEDLDAPGELARRLAEIVERPRLTLPPPGAPARGRWFAARWQDLRYAFRTLRRAPAFAAAVIVTLGLTIGPTTAMLSIGNWLLWQPAPGVLSPERLGTATFEEATPQYAIVQQLSYLNLDDLRAGSRTLAAFTGIREQAVNLAADEQPAQDAWVGFVRADFFDALGVRIATGRGFRADEDVLPHGGAVTVIGDGLARRLFGAAADALGRRLLLNGQPVTVVGVAPPSFVGTNPLKQLVAWVPAATFGYVHHASKPAPATRDSGMFNSFLLRLQPGASFETAKAELDVLLAGLVTQHPAENGTLAKVRANVSPGVGIQSGLRERYASRVSVLVTIGMVLLVLGCANVANLMLVRGVRGQRERAVRLALGASRGRLVMMQLTESVVLAGAGAALGVALAIGLKQFVATLLVPAVARWADFSVPLDLTVLALTAGVSMACGLVAGLTPALVIARTRSTPSPVHASIRATTGGRRIRAGLAAVQFALSMALLTGAFMLVTTLGNVMRNDLGFDPEGVTVHQIDATRQGYSDDAERAYYLDVYRRVSAIPGLNVASLSSTAFGSTFRMPVQDPGGGPAPIRVMTNAVSARFFDVLSLQTIQGRVFTDDEALAPAPASPNLVVVNEALARRAFGGASAVGQRLVLPKSSSDPPIELTVIGVTRSGRWALTGEPLLEMFLPLGHPRASVRSMALMIKSPLPARDVTRQVESVTMAVDPTLPLRFSGRFDAEIEYKLADRITFAWMLSILGWLGFALAAVGLFGLLAQSVAERTREFGIRLAVGSGRPHIFGLVLRQAASIGVVGTLAGLGLAAWGSRLIEAQLFGVTRWSPGAYLAAAAALLVVVLLAGLWPARTATRIEPVDALRVE